MLSFPDSSSRREKILEYLKHHAPFSVIDRGTAFAMDGHVAECSRSQHRVSGIVREGEGNHSCSLRVVSPYEVEGECSCSSSNDMREQWCAHCVALFIRSHDLGFFEANSGFEASESTFRAPRSSREIANVIGELSQSGGHAALPITKTPEVLVKLDFVSDRLGVQVLFDAAIQTPSLFEGFHERSRRALDNVLLAVLDEHGVWDEESRRWYINSSKGIEIALGLLEEYPDIENIQDGSRVSFAPHVLDARLLLRWQEAALAVEMEWKLPGGGFAQKERELLGTGPHWIVIGNVIYRVSSTASRIASLFPHGGSLSLPRTQVGPVLEVLATHLPNPELVVIEHPEFQPQAKVRAPKTVLHLERREDGVGHFSSRDNFQIRANLEFTYPTVAAEKNIVYLPDRNKEQECDEQLRALGFEPLSSQSCYVVTGEDALDIIYQQERTFPTEWRIEGLDALRKAVRFVDLALDVKVARTDQSNLDANKFDCHITLLQNSAHIPISTLFKQSRAESDRWVFLDSGAYARVPGGSLETLKTTLGMIDPNFKLSNAIRTSLSTAQAMSLTKVNDPLIHVALDEKLRALARKLENFEGIEQLTEAKGFEGELRSYQREGLSWLAFLHQLELGGILADEMGLGKTVQTLALLYHLKVTPKRTGGLTKPALVVAPTSVITNWLYEAKRFAPKLKVLLLHGPQRRGLFASIPEHDIVVTSYALLRLDRLELERFEFSYLILDEAQNIKNPEAATTKAAKALRSSWRLALSGTPTENRPLELWSLMDFLIPGYLGTYDFFRNNIERPILEQGTNVASAKILTAKVRPFLLRRRKHDVERELPPKVESVLHVDMAESQRELYQAVLDEVRPRVFDAINQKGIRGASISILAALLRLRQVCNHPNSIEALKNVPGYDSGKFNLMKDLVVEALENDHKILLFSQFREMLFIIRRWLAQAQVNYLYLDGATKNRQDLIDRFNADPSVRLFLISLKAGGTGLNLTAADTVIIYDPWWNPAVEHQAVDRAHRIGQHKTVSVYRLVTENSVEQKIMDLKAKKSKIVDALVNHEDALAVGKLGRSDLDFIFSPL